MAVSLCCKDSQSPSLPIFKQSFEVLDIRHATDTLTGGHHEHTRHNISTLVGGHPVHAKHITNALLMVNHIWHLKLNLVTSKLRNVRDITSAMVGGHI
ncbi:unnamed protein product [Citrullus colocynthis]|uniref:Uncharacterized protein n=1 Tax=Citrullus colocynthis TaxID=252529 RepID=A0ABP0YTH3_9ROSI